MTVEIYNTLSEAKGARANKIGVWEIRPQRDGTYRLLNVADGRGIPRR